MKNTAVVEEYKKRIKEAKALLADLSSYIEANGEVEMEEVHWGNAGDIGYVNSQLKKIRSFIRGEEE